jgi:hypothetical protein
MIGFLGFTFYRKENLWSDLMEIFLAQNESASLALPRPRAKKARIKARQTTKKRTCPRLVLVIRGRAVLADYDARASELRFFFSNSCEFSEGSASD